MKYLNSFLAFDHAGFFADKRLLFIKAEPWKDSDLIVGTKAVLQIFEDKTEYPRDGGDNFGEQVVVKVRGVDPSSFAKLKPFSTEVTISEVERATVFGEYRNQLSIIGNIGVKSA